MHGYFMDMRLYRKAKSIVEPFSVSRYKQQKIKEKISQQRPNRVQIQVTDSHLLFHLIQLNLIVALFVALFVFLKKLPQVNRELALKLMDEKETVTEKESQGKRVNANKMLSTNLLKDDRFKGLFSNPDFEIDKNAEEFRSFLHFHNFNSITRQFLFQKYYITGY